MNEIAAAFTTPKLVFSQVQLLMTVTLGLLSRDLRHPATEIWSFHASFFSLIAFEVCLPKDEVLSLADAHIINWRLWRGWRWQLELRRTHREQRLREIDTRH